MKNYNPFFEPKKIQFVYIPTKDNWEYSRLYLNISRQFLRFLTWKRSLAAIVAWFVFLGQIFFIIVWFLALFLVLSQNKKWAKRLHLLIPVIVYSKMSESEVADFLERNPQFVEANNLATISNSKIIETYVDDQSDSIMSKIEPKKEDATLKEIMNKERIDGKESEKNQNNTKNTMENSVISKSIFDDYESVMDKFNNT